jgi:hypothetical protein
MNSATETRTKASAALWAWRPLYWEPVAGTGERWMVGVLHAFGGQIVATRTIRDDVLDSLFGKSAANLRRLIDHALNLYQASAQAVKSVEIPGGFLAGLHPGPLRATQATSANDLLQTACLLYSSLSSLDRLDEAEESDAPQQDEVNHRFGSEVKHEVSKQRPELVANFGRAAHLVEGGQLVKFGFLSDKAIVHFTVLHPVRHSPSLRDARARIFELQRAREMSNIQRAVLIAAVPRDDDATLGTRQRAQLRQNKIEIEAEADAVHLRWLAVSTALGAAERVIEVAS